MLGVCAAYGKWLERVLALKLPYYLECFIGAIAMIGVFLIYQNNEVRENYLYLFEPFVAWVLVCVLAVLFSKMKEITKFFGWIGKHSMNIFFIHTFFYQKLCMEFIYSFRYAGFILLALLAISLLYSVVLEWLKRRVLKITKRFWIREKRALILKFNRIRQGFTEYMEQQGGE